MGTRPTPVVVCGAMAAHSQAALAAGAVDVVGALDAQPGSPQYVTALRRHLRVASRVRVITHPRNRLRARGLTGHMAPAAAHAPPSRRRPSPRCAARNVRVVVIGASTGGPPALATILADLPADLPVPVLVVQHMADGFVEGLASWLDGLSPLPVVMAQARPAAAAGCRARRPGRRSTPLLRARSAGRSCRPHRRGSSTSPGSTLRSPAPPRPAARRRSASCSPAWAATVPPGCARMRDAGAMTIGQDEPTSVVWGMPAAAQALAPSRPSCRCPPSPRPSSTAVAVAEDGVGHEDADRRRLRTRFATTCSPTAGLVFDESRRAGLSSVVADRLRVSGAPDVDQLSRAR